MCSINKKLISKYYNLFIFQSTAAAATTARRRLNLNLDESCRDEKLIRPFMLVVALPLFTSVLRKRTFHQKHKSTSVSVKPIQRHL